MAATVPELAEAAAHLERGDMGAALEVLCALWESTRWIELAELIETLVRRSATSHLPIRQSSSRSAKQAWLEIAAQQRLGSLGALLDVLPDTTGGIARERVRELLKWPRCPSLASAVLGWLRSCPFEGPARQTLLIPAIELLERQRDARLVPELEAMLRPEKRRAVVSIIGQKSYMALRAAVARMEDWPSAVRTPAAEREALERLGAARAPSPGRAAADATELVRAVYESPENIELRQVLADVLQERGDPRGEFIALQLARAAAGRKPERRERELFETWHRRWLGAIEPDVQRRGVVFEGGFVHACARSGGRILPGIEAQPEWNTIVRLDVSPASGFVGGSHRLLLGSSVRALRHVEGCGGSDLEAFAEHPEPRPWESLSFRLWSFGRERREALSRCAFPALARLGFIMPGPSSRIDGLSAGELDRVLDSPFGRPITAVELPMAPDSFGDCASLASRRGLESLAFVPLSRACTLVFKPREREVVLEIEEASSHAVEALAASLRSAPLELVDRVLLRVSGRARVDGGSILRGRYTTPLEPIRDALGRRPSIELTLPGA